MICPKCKKDYRDVKKGQNPGYYFHGDDHYYKDYRRFGMQCTNCGFIAEIISKVTGDPYRKKDLNNPDLKQTDMYEDTKN